MAAITFRSHSPRWAAIVPLRIKKPMHYARSLDEPLTDDSGLSLGDTVPDPRDHYDSESEDQECNEQLHTALEEALSKLIVMSVSGASNRRTRAPLRGLF